MQFGFSGHGVRVFDTHVREPGPSSHALWFVSQNWPSAGFGIGWLFGLGGDQPFSDAEIDAAQRRDVSVLDHPEL